MLQEVAARDKRVDQLAAIYKPKKVTYSEVRFVDLPGPRGKGMDADSLRALGRDLEIPLQNDQLRPGEQQHDESPIPPQRINPHAAPTARRPGAGRRRTL